MRGGHSGLVTQVMCICGDVVPICSLGWKIIKKASVCKAPDARDDRSDPLTMLVTYAAIAQ